MSETGAGAGLTYRHDGSDDLRAVLRSADWSSHPLGQPSSWPSRLQALVDVCAGSAVPMAAWWRPSSPERVVLCNDALRDVLGADAPDGPDSPDGPDDALRVAWPELDGLVAAVVSTGAPVVRESFCLAPIRDADGAVVAVHLVAARAGRSPLPAGDGGPGPAAPPVGDDDLLACVLRLCHGDGPPVLTAADADELVARVRTHVERARARERAALLAEARVADLEAALRSNRRIGQAIGILMARRRVTEQQAFELLRDHSQHTQRKLREVAEDVTFTGDLP